jgi:hypothetical protein
VRRKTRETTDSRPSCHPGRRGAVAVAPVSDRFEKSGLNVHRLAVDPLTSQVSWPCQGLGQEVPAGIDRIDLRADVGRPDLCERTGKPLVVGDERTIEVKDVHETFPPM